MRPPEETDRSAARVPGSPRHGHVLWFPGRRGRRKEGRRPPSGRNVPAALRPGGRELVRATRRPDRVAGVGAPWRLAGHDPPSPSTRRPDRVAGAGFPACRGRARRADSTRRPDRVAGAGAGPREDAETPPAGPRDAPVTPSGPAAGKWPARRVRDGRSLDRPRRGTVWSRGFRFPDCGRAGRAQRWCLRRADGARSRDPSAGGGVGGPAVCPSCLLLSRRGRPIPAPPPFSVARLRGPEPCGN